MLKYTISIGLILCCFLAQAQNKPIDTKQKDTVAHTQAYGLRVGVDLSRLLISNLQEDYSGLELVGDYRLTQKYYVAAELGNENKTRQEDLYNFTTKGSYLKVGIDYNTYGNWYGEQNLIYLGGRFAYSTFSQNLNEYAIFDSNRYWNPTTFSEGINGPQEYDGLSASWLEFVAGLKTELFANVFLGGSIRMGFLLTNKEPENNAFKNLFIPGFNKVTDGSRFGVGYNFSISYFIPFYKKSNKTKKLKEKDENETAPKNKIEQKK